MRSPSAWLAASSAAVALVGCGGHGEKSAPPPPRIPAGIARALAADADAVARAPSACVAYRAAVKLRRDALAGISRVPGRYQEQLMSAANELPARIGPCAHPRMDGGRVPRGRARELAGWLRQHSR